jgi:hypothetical protein
LNLSVTGTYHHQKKTKKNKKKDDNVKRGFCQGINAAHLCTHHLDPAIHGNPASIEVDEDRYELWRFHFWERQLERGKGGRKRKKKGGKSPDYTKREHLTDYTTSCAPEDR